MNPSESLKELPSGSIAVTEATDEEEAGEVDPPAEPEGAQSPSVLNDAGLQLESGEYQLASAQSEMSEEEREEEVVAVIAHPWVVLRSGSIIPLKMEVQPDGEVPTEYNVTYTLPPFELNVDPPGEEPQFVGMEATASAIVNGYCGFYTDPTKSRSPCGDFAVNRAAAYAEYFGNPDHDRNTYYHDYGENNCTNFVSQILARGHMSFMRAFTHGDGSWWYFNTNLPYPLPDHKDTESWRDADVLPRHLWQYGLANIDPSNQPTGWGKGDILAENWYRDGKGHFNHLQFVVGTRQGFSAREPLIANESAPKSANYSHKPWPEVRKRINEENPEGWNRVPLTVVHTTANYGEKGAKKHDPDNLYGPNGVFKG